MLVTIGCVLALAQTAAGQETGAHVPRVLPLAEASWSPEIRELAQTYAGEEGVDNALQILLRHPDAVRGVLPLARYLTDDSTLPPRDRELVWLRAAWLAGSEYLWSRHLSAAAAAGWSPGEIRRIAVGLDGDAWDEFEGALVGAVDELYEGSAISDGPWRVLATRYGEDQLLDMVLTAAEGFMLSMMWNSLGVPPDTGRTGQFPVDVVRSTGPVRRRLVEPGPPRLSPLEPPWTDQVQTLLDPGRTGRDVINLYRTLARHPAMYRPRAIQSAYIRTGSRLTDRAREILILRIGWLCGSEYEWAQHVRAARAAGMTDDEIRAFAQGPTAPGWDPFEAALIRAADELQYDARVNDATWQALATRYGEQELIDVLITVGGYRMVSVILNTLRTPLEPGREGFPKE
jgi:alkylhydroperoxidase family enzyme